MITVNRLAMLNLIGATLERDVQAFKAEPTSVVARRTVERTMAALTRTSTMPADDLNRVATEVAVGGWVEVLAGSSVAPVRALRAES